MKACAYIFGDKFDHLPAEVQDLHQRGFSGNVVGWFEDVRFVDRMTADRDIVVFNDSPGDDQFAVNAENGKHELTVGSFPGQKADGAVYRAEGFRDVLTRSNYKDDTDTATFIDSTENDKFLGRPNKARLYSIVEGNEFDVVVRNFDAAVVEFPNGGIDKARFRRPVVPGDVLHLDLTVLRRREIVCKMHGVATVEGQLAAEADIMANMVDRPET